MGSAKVQYGDSEAREMFRPGTKERDRLARTLGWMAKVAEGVGEDGKDLTFRVSSIKKRVLREEEGSIEDAD